MFVAIILLLSVSSAFYLNKLSAKTNAILKDNHFSVIYARDMTKELLKINQEITYSFLKDNNPDTIVISRSFDLFDKSLELEKNNITEVGEDTLVESIEKNYVDYRNFVRDLNNSPFHVDKLFLLQKKFDVLNQNLTGLSEMNQKVVEEKTNDAKSYSQKATLRMTFIGTICFLIAYGYTFVFSSYFNERFYRFYNGVKGLVSGNYVQRFTIEGNDELSEMTTIVNEMADKIGKNRENVLTETSDPIS